MSTATTPHPKPRAGRGVHVQRIANRPPKIDGDYIAVPVWVTQEGRYIGDAELRLTRCEAEALAQEIVLTLDAGSLQ